MSLKPDSRNTFPWRWPMRLTLNLLLLLLLPTTGCWTGRDGIIDGVTGRLTRSLGKSRASEPENLTASRSLEDIPLAQARGLEKKGELARAEAIYRRALEANPRNALAAHRLAVIADQRGEFEHSAWYFEQALWNNADDPDIRCDYGYSLYRQERWQDAEAQYQSALAMEAQHARTHNNYGLLLARTGRPDEALTSFRQAGCGQVEARMNLAFILASEGLTDLAQQQLDQAGQNYLTSSAVRERMEDLQQWIAYSAADAPSQLPVPVEEPSGDPAHRYAYFPPASHANPPSEPVEGSGPPKSGPSKQGPVTTRR
jgi:Tfp pilus assembly protein PilF